MEREGASGRAWGLLALAAASVWGCSPVRDRANRSSSSPSRADAIVVLGHRPPVDGQGQLRPELRRRVDHGVRLYEQGLAPRLVMSGGPSDVGIEAEHMRAAALAAGVPAAAILVEPASTTTIENARFTRRLLCERRRCPGRVLVVSNPLHARRAARLFRCAGFDAAATPAPFAARDVLNLFYEAAVGLSYLFFDACERAGGQRELQPRVGVGAQP